MLFEHTMQFYSGIFVRSQARLLACSQGPISWRPPLLQVPSVCSLPRSLYALVFLTSVFPHTVPGSFPALCMPPLSTLMALSLFCLPDHSPICLFRPFLHILPLLPPPTKDSFIPDLFHSIISQGHTLAWACQG